MIQQFAELGDFYRQKENVRGSSVDRLLQFTQDPAQKFRTTTILLLVFSPNGFVRVDVEHYDSQKKLRYLYRPGPPNGCDATPTTGLNPVKKGNKTEFNEALRKKVARLSRSVAQAIEGTQPVQDWERSALRALQRALDEFKKEDPSKKSFGRLLDAVKQCHPPDSKDGAILSIAWQDAGGQLRRVGDFHVFSESLIRQGERAASKKKGLDHEVKGIGQCCICGKRDVEVSGLLQGTKLQVIHSGQARFSFGRVQPA